MQRARAATIFAVGGALAGIAGAAVAAARHPEMREYTRRALHFARPLSGSSDPPVPPPLPPGRTVVLPGRGEVFVRDSGGEDDAVLLLHGWGATADLNFFTMYPALQAHHRVIAIDHRGHGRGLRIAGPIRLEDCADDAAAALDALGVPRATVVGYSMGGAIGLLLAVRRPDVCRGLVLEATALEFSSERRDQALWHGLPLMEAALRRPRADHLGQRIARDTAERVPALEPIRSWLAGEFRRSDVRSLVDTGAALSRFDGRPLAARVRVPTAVVVMRDDRLVPAAKQRAMAEALGASVFDLVADHDACIVVGPAVAEVTLAAIADVTEHSRTGAVAQAG